MSAAWLTYPLDLHSMRMFDCEGFTSEQCQYYMQRWHFWYESDHVFALPTIAFFMAVIGIFTMAHVGTRALGFSRKTDVSMLRKPVAIWRYMSYRGFHISSLRWNSAPLGILALGAVGTVFFFCMDLIPSPYYWSSLDYGGSPPLATRSGWMALACMPFIFATATKTNWITLLTGVTHEKLQVFHRWTAYAFFILALMHTFPFIVYHIRFHDMIEQVQSGLIFYWTGIVALIFQAWLTFASFGPFRKLGYEFFKSTHFLAVVIFVVIFFFHCDYTLSSWDYFIATAAIYVPCWTYPWLRTVFEHGFRQKAQVQIEENGYIRVTVPVKFHWYPGQHCFLRFRGFGLHTLTSHPFTICSLPSISLNKQSELTFYIRVKGGFTSKLHDLAAERDKVSLPILIDGPYGGVDNLKYFSSERLVVIAGGSGAGWMLPSVEQFCRFHSSKTFQQADGTTKTEVPDNEEVSTPAGSQRDGPRTLRLVLATRDSATHDWFLRKLSELLALYQLRDPTAISVETYLTSDIEASHVRRSRSPDLGESGSGSARSSQRDAKDDTAWSLANIEMKQDRSRPSLPHIIGEEALKTTEARHTTGVFVCGPITMQNDVRNAVANANLDIVKGSKSGMMYLHLEHFSWA